MNINPNCSFTYLQKHDNYILYRQYNTNEERISRWLYIFFRELFSMENNICKLVPYFFQYRSEILQTFFHISPQKIRPLIIISMQTFYWYWRRCSNQSFFWDTPYFYGEFDRPCSPTLTTNCRPIDSNLVFQAAIHLHLTNLEYCF